MNRINHGALTSLLDQLTSLHATEIKELQNRPSILEEILLDVVTDRESTEENITMWQSFLRTASEKVWEVAVMKYLAVNRQISPKEYAAQIDDLDWFLISESWLLQASEWQQRLLYKTVAEYIDNVCQFGIVRAVSLAYSIAEDAKYLPLSALLNAAQWFELPDWYYLAILLPIMVKVSADNESFVVLRSPVTTNKKLKSLEF